MSSLEPNLGEHPIVGPAGDAGAYLGCVCGVVVVGTTPELVEWPRRADTRIAGRGSKTECQRRIVAAWTGE